jgi:surfeit locus 1 family protein
VNRRMRWCVMAMGASLAIALTLSLGFWQLRRAAQKEAIAASMQASEARPSLTGAALQEDQVATRFLHQSVRLRGEWLPLHTVYLDNRQMLGRVGFYVMTPLRLEGTNVVVLVQRGWAPRNFVERSRLPEVQTAMGTVDIVGRIALPPSKLYEPGAALPGSIRQNLDFPEFRQETGLPLSTEFSIVQTGPASEGLLREWPVINLGVEKHYGYAAQWFALAALVAGLFFWFQVRPLLVSSKDSSSHV